MILKLHIYRFTCSSCCNEFKAPKMNSGSYGEFLLRNEVGNMLYVNAISDPVFQEVEDIIKMFPSYKNKSQFIIGNIVQKCFGLTCDSEDIGGKYMIGNPPVCPNCNSRFISDWEATEPPEYIDKDINLVSHTKWFTLSEAEKLQLLHNEVKNLKP